MNADRIARAVGGAPMDRLAQKEAAYNAKLDRAAGKFSLKDLFKPTKDSVYGGQDVGGGMDGVGGALFRRVMKWVVKFGLPMFALTVAAKAILPGMNLDLDLSASGRDPEQMLSALEEGASALAERPQLVRAGMTVAGANACVDALSQTYSAIGSGDPNAARVAAAGVEGCADVDVPGLSQAEGAAINVAAGAGGASMGDLSALAGAMDGAQSPDIHTLGMATGPGGEPRAFEMGEGEAGYADLQAMRAAGLQPPAGPAKTAEEKLAAAREALNVRPLPGSARPGRGFAQCDGCPEMVAIEQGAVALPENGIGLVERRVAVSRAEVSVQALDLYFAATGARAPIQCSTYEGGVWEPRLGRNHANPGYRVSDGSPAACVTWADAVEYAAWLSALTGAKYRLPTEAEWAVATQPERQADPCAPGNVAYHRSQIGMEPDCPLGQGRAHEAAAFEPARHGHVDGPGSLWEWVAAVRGDQVVVRALAGAAWDTPSAEAGWTSRATMYPGARVANVGFRLVVELDEEPVTFDVGAGTPAQAAVAPMALPLLRGD